MMHILHLVKSRCFQQGLISASNICKCKILKFSSTSLSKQSPPSKCYFLPLFAEKCQVQVLEKIFNERPFRNINKINTY